MSWEIQGCLSPTTGQINAWWIDRTDTKSCYEYWYPIQIQSGAKPVLTSSTILPNMLMFHMEIVAIRPNSAQNQHFLCKLSKCCVRVLPHITFCILFFYCCCCCFFFLFIQPNFTNCHFAVCSLWRGFGKFFPFVNQVWVGCAVLLHRLSQPLRLIWGCDIRESKNKAYRKRQHKGLYAVWQLVS